MLPMDKRTVLGPGFRIFRDPRGCLMMMADQMWQDFVTKIIKGSFDPILSMDLEFDFVMDCVLADCVEVRVDPQGRLVIPQKHRQMIGDPKNIVLKGKGHVVEMWSADGLKEYEAKSDEDKLTSNVRKYSSAIQRLFAPPQPSVAEAGGGQ